MTVRELLIAGRARVAAGWIQGELFDGRGNVCAVGALGVTERTLMHAQAQRAVALLTVHLPCPLRLGKDGLTLLAQWNNAPGRTQADILALYDRAIASLAPDPPALFHADDAAFLSRCRAVAKSPEPVTP